MKNKEEDFGEGSKKGNTIKHFIGGNKYKILSTDKESYIAPNSGKEILETNEIEGVLLVGMVQIKEVAPKILVLKRR